MAKKLIAILPVDGMGLEVIAQARRVLEHDRNARGLRVDLWDLEFSPPTSSATSSRIGQLARHQGRAEFVLSRLAAKELSWGGHVDADRRFRAA